MKENELQSNGQLSETSALSNKVKRGTSEGIFMSVSKKAEKITTALYMLTDLIREDDPMRRKIRETSISVLSDTRGLSYAMTGDLYFHLARVISKSWELMSFIEVCVVVGFISDMNYGILKNALVEFIGDLRNRQRIEGFTNMEDLKIGVGEAANFKLKSDFFKVDNLNQESYEAFIPEPKEIKSKGHLSRTSEPQKKSFINSQIETNNSESKASARTEKIISLIKEKKDISIKDIVSYFSEYSQKTIQRDLLSLVEAGAIKRTGEKRWSRYSI